MPGGAGLCTLCCCCMETVLCGLLFSFCTDCSGLSGGNWLSAVFQSCSSMAYLLRGNIHREGFVIGGGKVKGANLGRGGGGLCSRGGRGRRSTGGLQGKGEGRRRGLEMDVHVTPAGCCSAAGPSLPEDGMTCMLAYCTL